MHNSRLFLFFSSLSSFSQEAGRKRTGPFLLSTSFLAFLWLTRSRIILRFFFLIENINERFFAWSSTFSLSSTTSAILFLLLHLIYSSLVIRRDQRNQKLFSILQRMFISLTWWVYYRFKFSQLLLQHWPIWSVFLRLPLIIGRLLFMIWTNYELIRNGWQWKIRKQAI